MRAITSCEGSTTHMPPEGIAGLLPLQHANVIAAVNLRRGKAGEREKDNTRNVPHGDGIQHKHDGFVFFAFLLQLCLRSNNTPPSSTRRRQTRTWAPSSRGQCS
jgi:hypothetical protein